MERLGLHQSLHQVPRPRLPEQERGQAGCLEGAAGGAFPGEAVLPARRASHRLRMLTVCVYVQRLILQKAFSSQQLVHITIINLFELHHLTADGEQSCSGEHQTSWSQLLGLFSKTRSHAHTMQACRLLTTCSSSNSSSLSPCSRSVLPWRHVQPRTAHPEPRGGRAGRVPAARHQSVPGLAEAAACRLPGARRGRPAAVSATLQLSSVCFHLISPPCTVNGCPCSSVFGPG